MLNDSRKYYIRGVVWPAVLILLVHFGAYIINENQISPGYESEYLTQGGLNGMSFVLVLLNTIIVLTLSSPILLVDLTGKRKIARFLYWFLFPGSWLLYLVWRATESLLKYTDHGDDAFYVFSNSVPYIIGLIWSYIKFSKDLDIKNGQLPDLEVITKEDRKIDQPHTPPPQSPMG